jgi:putative ABC transport system ATP-binding protein
MADGSGSNGNNIIEVKEVWKTYRMGDTTLHALKGINLKIRRGEYISIMGPSGSGKTTLFNMVGALDRPSKGQVLVEGTELNTLNQRQIAYLRCHRIGYIFQSFNLIPVMTALDNVALPMVFAGLSREDYEEKARRKLAQQQQRVAIARAIANDPVIILADEPTGNLDLHTGTEIIELLKEMNKEIGATIITNTHDHKMLVASDRVVDLSDGAIEKIRNRDEIHIEEGTIAGLGIEEEEGK